MLGNTFTKIADFLPFIHAVELQRSIINAEYSNIYGTPYDKNNYHVIEKYYYKNNHFYDMDIYDNRNEFLFTISKNFGKLVAFF